MVNTDVKDNLLILTDMVRDITDSFPCEPPTQETYKMYKEAADVLMELGKQLRFTGYMLSGLYESYCCGDYDDQ